MKRDTWDRRGIWGAHIIAAIVSIVAFCAPAYADDAQSCGTEKSPAWCASLVAAPISLITSGERGEYLGGGLAVDGPLGAGFGLSASAVATGLQDGGSLDANPSTFRAVLVSLAVERGSGWLQVRARGGVSFSIEGKIGAPVDSRLWEGSVEALVDLQGLKVTASFGQDGSVGGLAIGAGIEIPLAGGKAPIVTRYVWPLKALAFNQGRPDTLTIGTVVRIKSFGLRRNPAK